MSNLPNFPLNINGTFKPNLDDPNAMEFAVKNIAQPSYKNMGNGDMITNFPEMSNETTEMSNLTENQTQAMPPSISTTKKIN